MCSLVCFEFRETKRCHCLRICRYFHEGYDCIPFFRYGTCHRQGNCRYVHRPHIIELLKQKDRMQPGHEQIKDKRTGDSNISSEIELGKQSRRNSLQESAVIDEDVISLPSDTELGGLGEGYETHQGSMVPQGGMTRPMFENFRRPINEPSETSGGIGRRPLVVTQPYAYRKTSPHHDFSSYRYRSGSPMREDYTRRRRSPSYTRDDSLAEIERDLPYPWFVARDRDGRIYFYNEDTRETTWENPSRRGHYVYKDFRGSTSDFSYPRPLHR